MYDKYLELYNDLIEIDFDELMTDISNAKRQRISPKYHPNNLMLDPYKYENWYKVDSDD